MGNTFVLAMHSIVLYSFCLYLGVRVTDVFWLRGIGNLPFFVLWCGWGWNELSYRWTLVFCKYWFQIL